MNLSLDKIRIDGGTQSRVKIDENLVAQYAEDMAGGSDFPAVHVFFDEKDYWLADGFHRFFARKRIGSPGIKVEVHEGSVRSAILFGIEANNKHGQRPSNEDKRKGTLTMLKDIEWQEISDREIAKICGVSHTYVSNLRRDLNEKKISSGNVATMQEPRQKKQEDPVAEFNESEIERETLVAASQQLREENENLQDQLAVAMAASGDELQREQAQSVIKDLRAQIRLLEIELKAVTISRDQFQAENAQLMKQVSIYQKKLKKFEGN
jgi:transcriptional regulator with XRE-family HTH domain